MTFLNIWALMLGALKVLCTTIPGFGVAVWVPLKISTFKALLHRKRKDFTILRGFLPFFVLLASFLSTGASGDSGDSGVTSGVVGEEAALPDDGEMVHADWFVSREGGASEYCADAAGVGTAGDGPPGMKDAANSSASTLTSASSRNSVRLYGSRADPAPEPSDTADKQLDSSTSDSP